MILDKKKTNKMEVTEQPLFDTTPFEVKEKTNPLAEAEAIPEKFLVVYINSRKNFRSKCFDTLEQASQFCNPNNAKKIVKACRVVNTRVLFEPVIKKEIGRLIP